MQHPQTPQSVKKHLSVLLIVVLLLTTIGGCGTKVGNFVTAFFPFKAQLPRGYVLVPGGSLTVGLTSDHTSRPRTVSVNSFYVKETCVTNEEYKIYLNRLREIYLEEKSADAKRRYKEAKPHGNVWKRPLAYHDSYIKGYSELERFKDFPAVVTWTQAKNFCDFLTEELREMTEALAENNEMSADDEEQDDEEQDDDDNDKGDNDDDAQAQGEDVQRPAAQEEEKSFASGYSLPSEVQWEVMAMGMAGAQDEQWQESPRRYTWSGHSQRTSRQTR